MYSPTSFNHINSRVNKLATSSATIHKLLEERILVIDGATGTQIQNLEIPQTAWLDNKGVDQEGCNELLKN